MLCARVTADLHVLFVLKPDFPRFPSNVIPITIALDFRRSYVLTRTTKVTALYQSRDDKLTRNCEKLVLKFDSGKFHSLTSSDNQLSIGLVVN